MEDARFFVWQCTQKVDYYCGLGDLERARHWFQKSRTKAEQKRCPIIDARVATARRTLQKLEAGATGAPLREARRVDGCTEHRQQAEAGAAAAHAKGTADAPASPRPPDPADADDSVSDSDSDAPASKRPRPPDPADVDFVSDSAPDAPVVFGADFTATPMFNHSTWEQLTEGARENFATGHFRDAFERLIDYAMVNDDAAGRKTAASFCKYHTTAQDIRLHSATFSAYLKQICGRKDASASIVKHCDVALQLLARLCEGSDVCKGKFVSFPHDQGEVRYANGDVYQGALEDGKPHGQGVMTYANGVVYKGGWKAGKEHGQGRQTSPKGDVYEGGWERGDFHGQGIAIYENGDVYVGGWANGKEDGQGRMTYKNGDVYQGAWQGKWSHGYGRMTYKNGDVYVGEWERGYMHGRGQMTYANGDVSAGVWVKGVPSFKPPPPPKTHKDRIDALVDRHVLNQDPALLKKLVRLLPKPAVTVQDPVKCREQLRAHPKLAFTNHSSHVADRMLRFLAGSARLAMVAEGELQREIDMIQKRKRTCVRESLAWKGETETSLTDLYNTLVHKFHAAVTTGLKDTSILYQKAIEMQYVLKLEILAAA